MSLSTYLVKVLALLLDGCTELFELLLLGLLDVLVLLGLDTRNNDRVKVKHGISNMVYIQNASTLSASVG